MESIRIGQSVVLGQGCGEFTIAVVLHRNGGHRVTRSDGMDRVRHARHGRKREREINGSRGRGHEGMCSLPTPSPMIRLVLVNIVDYPWKIPSV